MRDQRRTHRGSLPERVVRLLADGPSSSSDLALKLGVLPQRISSALWQLRLVGEVRIVDGRDRRNKIYGLGVERKPAPSGSINATPAPYHRGLAGWGGRW